MRKSRLTSPVSRREFLTAGAYGAGLIALSRLAPARLTWNTLTAGPVKERDRRVLVLIQLVGGNDGLNTLVPMEDPNYQRLRPQLAIAPKDLIPISGNLGFHPSCRGLAKLFQEGKLSVIQSVGYPNPSKNHYRSSEVWETATAANEHSATGWIGRCLDTHFRAQPLATAPGMIHIGDRFPRSFQSLQPHHPVGIQRPLRRSVSHRGHKTVRESARFDEQSRRQAAIESLTIERRIRGIIKRDRPPTRYPKSQLAHSLCAVTAMIAAGLETPFYFLSHRGYDTHRCQHSIHARLLEELSTAMATFQCDLEARCLDHRVLTMTFSEFGRRPAENNRGGTDHGTAAPLVVMGSSIQEPLIGSAPRLDIAPSEDLPFSTDFRQVYATVLDRWFHTDAQRILGRSFAPLEFI